jgi:uncharacterized protein
MSHETLDADAVAAFLRRRSDFLVQFPDLASSLQLPKANGEKVANLTGYQLDVLREKNQQLSTRLNALIQVAQDNELLVQRTHLLAVRLLKTQSLHEAVWQIAASLTEDFRTDLIKLCLIGLPHVSQTAVWLDQVSESDPGLLQFADAMRTNSPLCGRLKREKLEFLFGAKAEHVASAVLLPMSPIGLLAVGSADPNRFHPGMGTVFLDMIGELVRTALAMHAERTR